VALTSQPSRPWSSDPFLAFNFVVEVAGVLSAGFSEVSGLQSEVELFDYREGGRNEFLHRFPGPAKYGGNLVLKRGLTGSGELWEWYLDSMHGVIVRLPVSVLLLDGKRDVAWRWDFVDACPVKWTGPDLRATTGAIAFEAVEFAHRGVDPGVSGSQS
jgi:phage tail-like protein